MQIARDRRHMFSRDRYKWRNFLLSHIAQRVKNMVLLARLYARVFIVHRSFASSSPFCATRSLFIVSWLCVFERCKTCVPFDTSNNREKSSIAARLWKERERKEEKKKDKAAREKRQLAILHKNTDKARILDAIAIPQLRCHYTAIIHCLWGTETYHVSDKHRDAYFPESLPHRLHDRFYDTRTERRVIRQQNS